MFPFTIRPARATDAADISAIMHELGWFGWAETPAETTEQIEERLLKYFSDNENRTVLVAENAEGKVVGFTCVHWLYGLRVSEGYISHLFISQHARGQGTGRQLLASVTELAKARECSRLMLYIREHREAYQRGFYYKAGWQEEGDVAFFTLNLNTP